MFGCRTAIGLGYCALAFGLAFGCGGAVEHGGEVTSSGAGHGAVSAGGAGGSSAGTHGVIGRAGSNGSAGFGVGGSLVNDPPPVDAGCPIQDLPPPVVECDAFVAGSCGPGAGCYPFVDHPEGSGCDQQRYGTRCLPAGQGTQGALCGEIDWCAEGFVCVVGQRAGKRCAALCKLGGTNQCAGGLVCGDLDVAGFGVCG